MAIRLGLLSEVVAMAFDTVRTNKMRSGLTILGVVIGITSIVGMTSMIRGFDQSLRDSIKAIGPNIIIIQRFGPLSFTSGQEFQQLIRRPVLTVSDARAIEQQASTIQLVDVQLGVGGGPPMRALRKSGRGRPVRDLRGRQARTGVGMRGGARAGFGRDGA